MKTFSPRVILVAFRVVVVHSVVAILLVCPFICMAEAATIGHAASLLRKPSCCGCCSRSAPEDGKNAPGMPDSGQGSSTCLCHGAVMDRQIVATDASHDLVTIVVMDALSSSCQSPTTGRYVFTDKNSCHFPTADSGKGIRALIASLLL
jgi:hypothetical protein